MPPSRLLAFRTRARNDPRGFILLAVLVFLLLVSLLSMGDLRTVITQQRLVSTHLETGNEFAYTQSALLVLESFATEEIVAMMASPSYVYKGGSGVDLNKSCASTAISDPLACTLAACSASSSLAGILDSPNGISPRCSFCPRPSPGCKSRLLESKTAGGTPRLPWAELPLRFKYTDSQGQVINNNYIGKFYTHIEYLGKAPCDYSVNDTHVTKLGTYGSTLCPGSTLNDGTPRCTSSTPATFACPVMRVTVSNKPESQLKASITLQSTLIGGSAPYPAKRISFRQVLPQ